MSIESVMPSNHLIFCCPLLLPPSIFPSIRVFSKKSVLHIRWPKYWSFSFNISPSNVYSGLISFRMDWLDLLAVQETLKSLLQCHSSKAKWSIPKSDWLYSLKPKMEKLYTVSKTRLGADCGSDHELLIAKFRLKLKKVGKTTKPFRYNQIKSLTLYSRSDKLIQGIRSDWQSAWRTMDGDSWHCTRGGDQDHPQEKVTALLLLMMEVGRDYADGIMKF